MVVSIKRRYNSKSNNKSNTRKHFNKSRKCGSKTRKMKGGANQAHTPKESSSSQSKRFTKKKGWRGFAQ